MKVTWRNREILEAEESLKELAQLDVEQKLAYAISKNLRIIGNEAQDLRYCTQMNKEKYQDSLEFNEKKQIITEDKELSSSKRLVLIQDLEENFKGIRHAIDNHNRGNIDFMKKDQELELYIMDWGWFPKKLKAAAIGPLIDIITNVEKALDE